MAYTAFLTDATICIGCKACEVACKEWNEVPEDGLVLSGFSYDNTQALGASTWRHVLFLEQPEVAGLKPRIQKIPSAGFSFPMSVSIAPMPGALNLVRPARLCARKWVRSLSSRMCAMVADIVSSLVLLE